MSLFGLIDENKSMDILENIRKLNSGRINEPLPVECGCKLALKFTALKFTIKPSLYRKPLALRERIFACETVEGLARSFMSFKKYKF